MIENTQTDEHTNRQTDSRAAKTIWMAELSTRAVVEGPVKAGTRYSVLSIVACFGQKLLVLGTLVLSIIRLKRQVL